ncbi:DUF1993 domain-containing protein [Piscinibacter sp. XHJ-5]|uniref:DUF1993 domain-containing protein n=1 Tax=Piscinibacter sp. XHJ-5 TaxID=3037797 RepID=UPI002452FFDB|nr:DUF1993 domain-containing protein [Piscinibacter sp. XHJ-5]
MSISMHSASVPLFVRMLGNLQKWLDKAEAHASAKKFDAGVLLTARLAPDMLPLTSQIQIACDGPKLAIARLAGVDAPKFEDNETTFDQLRERIRKTIDYVQSVPPAQVDGTEDKDIAIPRRDGTLTMKGEPYLREYVLPNFFFHVTTAYALLRHNGVDLGKKDYLGLVKPT